MIIPFFKLFRGYKVYFCNSVVKKSSEISILYSSIVVLMACNNGYFDRRVVHSFITLNV